MTDMPDLTARITEILTDPCMRTTDHKARLIAEAAEQHYRPRIETVEHDAVDHPAHYTAHPSGIECIELTRLLPFAIGNAVKYIWRWELKNGIEDLRKARWYVRDAIAHPGLNRASPSAWRLGVDVIDDDCNPDRAALLHTLLTDRFSLALEILDRKIDQAGGPDA